MEDYNLLIDVVDILIHKKEWFVIEPLYFAIDIVKKYVDRYDKLQFLGTRDFYTGYTNHIKLCVNTYNNSDVNKIFYFISYTEDVNTYISTLLNKTKKISKRYGCLRYDEGSIDIIAHIVNYTDREDIICDILKLIKLYKYDAMNMQDYRWIITLLRNIGHNSTELVRNRIFEYICTHSFLYQILSNLKASDDKIIKIILSVLRKGDINDLVSSISNDKNFRSDVLDLIYNYIIARNSNSIINLIINDDYEKLEVPLDSKFLAIEILCCIYYDAKKCISNKLINAFVLYLDNLRDGKIEYYLHLIIFTISIHSSCEILQLLLFHVSYRVKNIFTKLLELKLFRYKCTVQYFMDRWTLEELKTIIPDIYIDKILSINPYIVAILTHDIILARYLLDKKIGLRKEDLKEHKSSDIYKLLTGKIKYYNIRNNITDNLLINVTNNIKFKMFTLLST